MAREEWRPIPGFSRYEASDAGRIRSWARPGPPGLRKEPKVLSSCLDKNDGYLVVCIRSDEGKKGPQRVHRLVLMAFRGLPMSPNDEGCHFPDPARANNRLDNLQWGSHAANMEHRREHGTAAFGDKNGSRLHPDSLSRGEEVNTAKLTEDDVRAIRESHDAGETQVALAARYGVQQTTISRVVLGRTWRHIS
jgi:hypothetical protein